MRPAVSVSLQISLELDNDDDNVVVTITSTITTRSIGMMKCFDRGFQCNSLLPLPISIGVGCSVYGVERFIFDRGTLLLVKLIGLIESNRNHAPGMERLEMENWIIIGSSQSMGRIIEIEIVVK